MPWDIDPWRELNNGRTLTLYDLGRMPLVVRIRPRTSAQGRTGWGMTVAGSSVRYRRRVRAFHRVEMRSAFVGRDARFLYVSQAMFRDGEALSGALIRGAVTDARRHRGDRPDRPALGRPRLARPARPGPPPGATPRPSAPGRRSSEHDRPPVARRGVFGWMLFDWANQPFQTLIVTFIFAPYFAAEVVGDPVRGPGALGRGRGGRRR